MSLARAFTTRRGKQPSTDSGVLPHRSNTTKGHGYAGSIRNKISSPMELTHTTNMLAYNAPDLYPRATTSLPNRSSKSDDESSLSSPSTTVSSPPTSPEISSGDRMSGSVEPNHLSCYFTVPPPKPTPAVREAPVIPKRAPSHTKKASFENLANKHARFSNQSSKTISTKASFTMSRSSSTSTSATSVSSASQSLKSPVPMPVISPTSTTTPLSAPRLRRGTDAAESPHPFGHELAKVSELAEELGVKDKLQGVEDEEQQLMAKGLLKFRAEDYLAEIHELISNYMVPEPDFLQQPVWI